MINAPMRDTASPVPGEPSRNDANPVAWLFGWLFDFLVAARRHLVVAIGLPATGIAIGLVLAFVLPKSYTASGEFVPDSDPSHSSLSSALRGFASQLGGFGAVGDSPQFYADMLTNKSILTKLLYKSYPGPLFDASKPMRLIDSYKIKEPDTPKGRESGLGLLKPSIAAMVDPRTGVIKVQAEAGTPQLAVAITKDLMGAVNDVNIQMRQRRAEANAEFLRDQLAPAKADLDRAESNMSSFMSSNRDFETPALRYQQARLQRAYDMATETYIAQRRQLNEAMIESARNTPALIILTEPVPITKASHPKRKLVVAEALAVAMLITLLLLRLREPALFRERERRIPNWQSELTRFRLLNGGGTAA